MDVDGLGLGFGDYIRLGMVGPGGPTCGPQGGLAGWWLDQVGGRLVRWNRLAVLWVGAPHKYWEP